MAFNDASIARITKTGVITINADGIYVDGFDADGVASCREVAILAAAWAIGQLQAEMLATMLKPGGTGRLGID